MNIHAAGIVGDASVTINFGMCAGRVALTQGEATIRDACFTGDTNVVLGHNHREPNQVRFRPPREPSPSRVAAAISSVTGECAETVRS